MPLQQNNQSNTTPTNANPNKSKTKKINAILFIFLVPALLFIFYVLFFILNQSGLLIGIILLILIPLILRTTSRVDFKKIIIITAVVFAVWMVYWYFVPNPLAAKLAAKRELSEYDLNYRTAEVYSWVTEEGRIYIIEGFNIFGLRSDTSYYNNFGLTKQTCPDDKSADQMSNTCRQINDSTKAWSEYFLYMEFDINY